MTISFDPLSARDAPTKEWSGRAESAGDAMVAGMKSAREWAEETVTEDAWLRGYSNSPGVDLADSTADGIEDAKATVECLVEAVQRDARAPLEEVLRETLLTLKDALIYAPQATAHIRDLHDAISMLEEALR